MSDLDDEIRAARIRHYGPCPHEKGHTQDAVFGAIMVTFFLTTMTALFISGWVTETPALRAEAIKRGYAIHNPQTGVFQWR